MPVATTMESDESSDHSAKVSGPYVTRLIVNLENL